MENYEVQQGDCLSSLAFEYGLMVESIWQHPNNAQLKQRRKDPNLLLPGDIVFIPDKRLKSVERPSNDVHKFRCKNAPEKLRLQLFIEEKPRAYEEYKLEIENLKFSGKTDSQGRLEQSIPPNAKTGKLLLANGTEIYQLQLGHLNPSDEITGAQGRLWNLGLYFGPIDGIMSDELEEAIQEYQFTKNIEPDGKLNPATTSALKQDYGA